jgi:hypothetical protein
MENTPKCPFFVARRKAAPTQIGDGSEANLARRLGSRLTFDGHAGISL